MPLEMQRRMEKPFKSSNKVEQIILRKKGNKLETIK